MKIEAVQKTDSLCETDGSDVVGGSRFELERQFGVGRSGEGDGSDHIASSHERGHLVEQSLLAVEYTDTGRPI